jgi:hypothetical protein
MKREWSTQWFVASSDELIQYDVVSFYELVDHIAGGHERGEVVLRRVIARIIDIRDTYAPLEPDHCTIALGKTRARQEKTLEMRIIVTHGSTRLRRGCVIERFDTDVMASPGVYIRQDRRK